jgi:hypothetical protein
MSSLSPPDFEEVDDTGESDGQGSSDEEIHDMTTGIHGFGGVTRAGRVRMPSSHVTFSRWLFMKTVHSKKAS